MAHKLTRRDFLRSLGTLAVGTIITTPELARQFWLGIKQHPISINGVGYSTLAAAIAAANNGDTIYVSEGIYSIDGELELPEGIDLIASW